MKKRYALLFLIQLFMQVFFLSCTKQKAAVVPKIELHEQKNIQKFPDLVPTPVLIIPAQNMSELFQMKNTAITKKKL